MSARQSPSPAPARRAVGPLPRTRPGLTPEGIVTAGRRIIERDGLDALSMRTVATELGTAATSLYRHVADRDALLVGILEDVARGMPVDVPGTTPELRLRRRWGRAHDYLAEHSWVVHILIRGEMIAEEAFRFSDACLADFMEAGMTPRKAFTAFTACWHLTIGEILDSHPLQPPREPTQRRAAVSQVDARALPAAARVWSEVPPPQDRRDAFPDVLRILLVGLLADIPA